MPVGTPADYERAIAEEMREVPLDYPGRGKLDVHAAVENTLLMADRFAEVVEGAQPGLEAELVGRAVRVEASHRRRDLISRLAFKVGDVAMRAAENMGQSYADAFGDSRTHPPASNWGFF